jgi:hypothetical protein
LDKKHLAATIVQAYNQPDIAQDLQNVDANEILKYLEEPGHDWDLHLQHGVGYGGAQQFASVGDMVYALKALIEYSETNSMAAPDIKPKLRFITKSLRGDEKGFQEDRLGVIPMLAVHGSVCNVMKEVGIRAAYGAMSETIKSDKDVNDVGNCVLRFLYEFRELRVEHLLVAHIQNGSTDVNTHNVVCYRNNIGPFIGLARIPDPDMNDNQLARQMTPTFFGDRVCREFVFFFSPDGRSLLHGGQHP